MTLERNHLIVLGHERTAQTEQPNRLVTHLLTKDSDGKFVDAVTGEKKEAYARIYSLTKFGSAVHIRALGQEMAGTFTEKLHAEDSQLRTDLRTIRERGENIVLLSPGTRNVRSSSTFILEEAVAGINIELALMDLPTIIMMKPPRLASNPANYAELSAEEREARLTKTKSVLPGKELFQHGVHAIFADDIRITGKTAERVEQACKDNGALSFTEMYSAMIDPHITEGNEAIEQEINSRVITGALDEHVRGILNQDEFRPVQRMVRLILHEKNRTELPGYLAKNIADQAVVKLYIASLNNDYHKQPQYADSVPLLRTALTERGIVDGNGRFQVFTHHNLY